MANNKACMVVYQKNDTSPKSIAWHSHEVLENTKLDGSQLNVTYKPDSISYQPYIFIDGVKQTGPSIPIADFVNSGKGNCILNHSKYTPNYSQPSTTTSTKYMYTIAAGDNYKLENTELQFDKYIDYIYYSGKNFVTDNMYYLGPEHYSSNGLTMYGLRADTTWCPCVADNGSMCANFSDTHVPMINWKLTHYVDIMEHTWGYNSAIGKVDGLTFKYYDENENVMKESPLYYYANELRDKYYKYVSYACFGIYGPSTRTTAWFGQGGGFVPNYYEFPPITSYINDIKTYTFQQGDVYDTYAMTFQKIPVYLMAFVKISYQEEFRNVGWDFHWAAKVNPYIPQVTQIDNHLYNVIYNDTNITTNSYSGASQIIINNDADDKRLYSSSSSYWLTYDNELVSPDHFIKYDGVHELDYTKVWETLSTNYSCKLEPDTIYSFLLYPVVMLKGKSEETGESILNNISMQYMPVFRKPTADDLKFLTADVSQQSSCKREGNKVTFVIKIDGVEKEFNTTTNIAKQYGCEFNDEKRTFTSPLDIVEGCPYLYTFTKDCILKIDKDMEVPVLFKAGSRINTAYYSGCDFISYNK